MDYGGKDYYFASSGLSSCGSVLVLNVFYIQY